MPQLVDQRLAVANRVAELMKARGITQQQAADVLFTSQSALSRRLLGRVEFRPSELHTLARLLGVSVAELVDPEVTA